MSLLAAPLEPIRDEGRELLEQEVEKPEYQREFGGPLREIFDAMVGWLEEHLGSIGGVTIAWGPVVLAVLLLGAILLVVLLVRPRLQAATPREELLDTDHGITAAALRARAGERLHAGDPDEAYRDLFRALVRGTEERGILTDQTGRTATEAAFAVGSVFPDQAQSLQRCADRFNLSRYGGGSVSEGDCRELADLDRTLSLAEPAGTTDRRPLDPQVVAPQ